MSGRAFCVFPEGKKQSSQSEKGSKEFISICPLFFCDVRSLHMNSASNDLLSKEAELTWGEKQDMAFNMVKQAMSDK